MKASILTLIALIVTTLAGYVTHIVVAIKALAAAKAVSVGYGILLAVGVFVPPVGVIHGIGLWFGAW